MKKASEQNNNDNGKRILVPIDYSECSRLACNFALKLAEKMQAEIKLLHVYYSPAIDLIDLAGTGFTQKQLKEDVINSLEAKEQKKLNDYTNEIKEFASKNFKISIPVSSALSIGLAENEILSVSDEYKPNLIVLGTKGRHQKEFEIFGGVTVKVMERAKVPVISIPEDYEFIGIENIKSIVYVTDFDESDFMAIKKLMDLIDVFDMKTYCVNIGKHGKKQWDKAKMDGLKEYFRSVYNKFNVECALIESEDILEGLDNFIIKNNISIISLTTHKRGLLAKLFNPSLPKKIFYHTNKPLLVFHS